MFRLLSIACAIVVVGLLGAAGYLAFRPSIGEYGSRMMDRQEVVSHTVEVSDGLVVENARQYLGERSVGEVQILFHVTNRSDRGAEVVSNPSRCGLQCCFTLHKPERIPVPPGKTIDMAGVLDVHRAGPFEFEANLYLEVGGQLRAVRLNLSGVGVEPGGKSNVPPP